MKAATSILPDTLEQLERNQATRALTVWRGFEAFCKESVGVEATAVLKVVLEPGAEKVAELEDLAERLQLEPDALAVEEIRAELTEAWRIVERAG